VHYGASIRGDAVAKYLSVEEAIPLRGLRLVLTRGVPGPWGEAAKAIFHVKRIPYVRVGQVAGENDEALIRWTGAANAPTAMYDDERPRSERNAILFLAERLAPDPPLLPRDPEQRALCLGLSHEIAGELGFGWCRRLMLLQPNEQAPPAARAALATLSARYGSPDYPPARAAERCAEIMRALARRLHAQRAAGNDYLLGDALSVADLYWATFAAMLRPLPEDLCPMSLGLRTTYTARDPVLTAALDPILLEHRDGIYRRHLELPVDC
jgi:glutathione S-transferase